MDYLHNCQILFPPQILFELWPQGGDQIVEVHEHVNDCVTKSDNCGLETYKMQFFRELCRKGKVDEGKNLNNIFRWPKLTQLMWCDVGHVKRWCGSAFSVARKNTCPANPTFCWLFHASRRRKWPDEMRSIQRLVSLLYSQNLGNMWKIVYSSEPVMKN